MQILVESLKQAVSLTNHEEKNKPRKTDLLKCRHHPTPSLILTSDVNFLGGRETTSREHLLFWRLSCFGWGRRSRAFMDIAIEVALEARKHWQRRRRGLT